MGLPGPVNFCEGMSAVMVQVHAVFIILALLNADEQEAKSN
jgi:hypothetical protein